ncbi:unnamed protein product [Periconia digitata]|uniref:Uncharacterized protein n=1 Tax=Periconia digitata TaxID=1303443 RepID=A0A9W4UFC6_9PLEO|nr:unnamed protein product [Periconia digitata]
MFFWAYPISLWIGYVASRIYEVKRHDSHSQPRSKSADTLFLVAHIGLFLSIAFTEILSVVLVSQNGYGNGWAEKDYLSSTFGVGLFYLAGLLPDPDERYTASIVNRNMWLISTLYEVLWLAHGWKQTYGEISDNNAWHTASAVVATVRILILVGISALFIVTNQRKNQDWSTQDNGERQPLLGNGSQVNGANGKTTSTKRSGDAQTTTWTDYLLGFKALFPFLWPSNSKPLQVRAIFCFLLLIAQRIVNILAPHQLGVVVAHLGRNRIPHLDIVLYILFRGLQGQQGVIGSIRAMLWIPISQSTYQRLSSATFTHVLQLSLDFHLSKRVGEVISALSKGGALNTFLDGLAFQLFPMVADLWIAAAYFFVVFDAFYSLIVIAVTWFYIYVTIYMAKYRGRARREMAKREREMEAAKTDALLSYETVHHFGAVPMEVSRYEMLIAYFQAAEFNVLFSLNMLNAVQNGVFTLGTLLVCYLDAYQISMDLQKVAMFVTLLTYLAQLQAPLNFFGSFYTQVQNNLVDAERMLELYEEKPTVVDADDTMLLKRCSGHISFSNVKFAYNEQRQALRGISFEVLSGTSTAIVGESGSGKSTLLKLLFRFYDVNSGTICVDGKDVQKIQIKSLRDYISVVPQDTILFNNTLMYNLKYARPDATDEQVFDACRSATIHDKIMSFPGGYSTSVGERGLKLSGGERQRIAISRAFLRAPSILLLDEATASLDSETEGHIQEALERVSRGRTTITIAHRLSTIVKADQIIVLQEGRIVERGTHAQLLQNNGLYLSMWEKQTLDEEEK